MSKIINNKQLKYMRSREFIRGRRCYELALPWMDPDSIIWIHKNLKSHYNCLEFGSGGSTLFFEKLVNHVDTYEADIKWYKMLKDKNSSSKINYNYINTQEKLLKQISEIPSNYYNVCVVDIGPTLKGRSREEIFLKCVPKMKKDTIYILDNGFSKHHYFNIWKWNEKNFQELIGDHYKMIDFNSYPDNKYSGTRILYPVL